MALDLNRGVKTRFHPNGMKVSMYLDDPGTYLDDLGKPFPDELAKQAGFDLDKWRKEKLKLQKLAAFKKQLDQEYASAEEQLATELSRNGGHDVRAIGGGQYALFGKDGSKVMVGTKAEIELMVGPIQLDPELSPAA
jgi:hypothetical protein